MIEDPVLRNEWFVAASSDDVPEGKLKAVKILGEDVVLWRSGGKVIAWKDLCIHRGTKLSLGEINERGCVVCPYHGWEFNDSGKCTRIPAIPGKGIPSKAKTIPFIAEEKYEAIWVCLGEPVGPIPTLEVPDDYEEGWGWSTSDHFLNAKAPRIVENYLDFSHLPFLHGGFLGDPEKPEVEDYKVQKNGHRSCRARLENLATQS